MTTIRRTAAVLGLLAIAATAQADDRRYQTSDVIDISGAGGPYQGAAWLIRTEDEIEGRIMTRVSTAGAPYTLWIVIFNNPAACGDNGCGDDEDFANPDIGISVFNGTGAISVPDGDLKPNGKPSGRGMVNFDFEIEAGGLPNGLFLLFGAEDGLAEGNGYGAEVHLVIDRHPRPANGLSWIPDLTTTNFPGLGPAVNDRAAVFLACPDDDCPGSVL